MVAGEDWSVVIGVEHSDDNVQSSSAWHWTAAVDCSQSQPVLGPRLAVHAVVQSQLHLGRAVQFGADIQRELAGRPRRRVELVALDAVVWTVVVAGRRQHVGTADLRRLDDRQLDLGVTELWRIVVHVQNFHAYL